MSAGEGSGSTGQVSALSLLASVAQWLAIPAAYLFFVGFLYCYYYFRGLGVPVKLIDIPLPYFPVYAFSVLMENQGWVMVWLGLILLVALLLSRGVRFSRVTFLTLILVAFPTSWKLARERGYREAYQLRNGFGASRVTFVLSEDDGVRPVADQAEAARAGGGTGLVSQRFREANEAGRLILVTETSRAYYVLLQPYPERSLPELPRGRLYMVPRDRIQLAETKLPSVRNLRPGSSDVAESEARDAP